MKKNTGLLLFAVTLLCGNVAAAPVSLQSALQSAREFVGMRKAKRGDIAVSLTLSYTQKSDGVSLVDSQPLFYVFNVGTNRGFVIISGDDTTLPVLGYSDEGAFDYDQAPDNMKSWLEGYASDVTWSRTQRLSPYQPIRKSSSRESVPYLVKAKWGQGSPYYNQTPKYSGKYCYTGCVATAMAQVMYYWATTKNFCHGSEAIPSYTTTKLAIEVPALAAVEQFDWDNMTDSKPTTTAGKNAVAKLMRYCGQAVQMNYSTTGSGAYPDDIPRAMYTYFGYDKRIRIINSFDTSASEWEETLYQELAEGRPVCMSGDNFFKSTSHEFVCDGYNASTDKYHFNWGFDGTNNGYFAISALNPTAKTSYNDRKIMVAGIQPDTHDDTLLDLDLPTVRWLYLTGPKSISRDHRTEDGAEMVSVYGAWKMETAGGGLFDCACGVYDTQGSLVDVACQHTLQIADYETQQYHYELALGAELPYGDYTIVPVCRPHGQQEWKRMNHAATKYATATVAESTITLTSSYDIEIESFSHNNDDGLATLTLTNKGTEETMGYLTIFVDGEQVGWVEPHLAVGETRSLSVNYDGDITPTTLVMIQGDDLTEHEIFNNDSSYGDVLWRHRWDNYVDTSGRLYGDSCKAQLLLNNKGTHPYTYEVTATLFERGTDPDKGVKQTMTVSLPPKSSTVVAMDFGDVNIGTTYDLRWTFTCGHNMMSVDVSTLGMQVTPTHGVVAVCRQDTLCLADDDHETFVIPEEALYVDARYTAKPDATMSGGNANTLFVFAADAVLPASLQGHNVVTGYHANHLTLVDGLDFLSPVEFVADQASYTRIFGQGHGKQRDGWSTVVLPFAVLPQDVTVGDVSTSWYQNANDRGEKFFVFAFDGEDNGEAAFSYISEMKAYQPYLIAVSDDSWGTKYDLRGKTFRFTSTNALIKAGPQKAVTTGGSYDLVGRTYTVDRHPIHALNEQGSSFVHTDEAVTVPPFRAYFVSYDHKKAALSMRLR